MKLEQYGFYIFEGQTILDRKQPFTFYDKEGFLYYLSYQSFQGAKFKASRVSKYNKYSILNIQRYLWLKDAKTTLVYKGEYNRNKQKLLFRCDCGNEYYETWNHVSSSNRLCCPSCARAISKTNGSRKLHTADIKADCQKQGIELIYFHGNAKDVHYKDSDGYKYNTTIFSIRKGLIGDPTKRFAKINIYALENMKFFLKTNNIQTKLSDNNSYLKANQKLEFICPECNNVFYSKWENVAYKGRRLCDRCGHIKSNLEFEVEEYLKTLGVKYESEKRFDDCVNIRTLPFDFYLPEYNCCIEVQGQQHYYENDYFIQSLEERKRIDKIKEDYCKDHNIKLLQIPFWYITKKNTRYMKEINSIFN